MIYRVSATVEIFYVYDAKDNLMLNISNSNKICNSDAYSRPIDVFRCTLNGGCPKNSNLFPLLRIAFEHELAQVQSNSSPAEENHV